MIVSLSAFFATDRVSGKTYTDKQRREIIKWFWKSNFSRRYNSGIQDKHKTDIKNLRELSAEENKEIANFECTIEPNYFLESNFTMGTVNTKTFVLMLANKGPKSFISGANVRLGDVLKTVNRNEFHHIFPKKFLERNGVDKKKINCLANFCFLNNADNQKIKDKDPKIYKALLPSTSIKEIMEHSLCVEDSLDLDYVDFINKRVEILIEKANNLIA